MSRFVLTAQLQLQAPNNVRQIVQQIQSQLQGVNVNVQVQNAPQAQRQLQRVTQATNQATSAAERMGRAFAISVRRFAAFSIATRAVSLFTSTLGDAVQTAIDFERQLIKVSQVTGKSIGQLRGLTNQITDLATGFGVASSDLLGVSTILAQAGLSAEDTAVALRTLAKAALAPNFDSISETAEGAIAILAQFGQGVEALESQLGSINAVAGAFAVEASDLIDVIRRTGGVFKSSGGDLNELLALFTSVRATTRESAESIGTGLRTIFTRIQRPKTIEFLKQFGVELVDLNGKFVGPFEAIKRLSEALAGLGEGDITFIRIAEELGGFRQIGKVLPLLQQFSTAQAALSVATKANNSLTQDAASAQAALAIRILKVKEEFLALIRSITETSTFQVMANTALTLASSLIKIADAIKPLLPMLAALAAFRLARGMGSFFGGIMSGAASARTYNKGGKVLAFARGGLVPGSGNGDTVPAMLAPGEFVIRKSSVNKLGTGTLAAMNENRFAVGGIASENKAGMAIPDTFGDSSFKSSNVPVSLAEIAGATPQSGPLKSGSLLSQFSFKNTKTVQSNRPNILPSNEFKQALQGAFGFTSKTYIGKTAGVSLLQKTEFNKILTNQMQEAIRVGASEWSTSVGVPLSPAEITFGEKFTLAPGLAGSFFESVVDAFQGRPIGAEASENKRPFDFISGLRGGANSKLFANLQDVNYIDAKKSASLATDSEYKKKIASQLAIDGFDEVAMAVQNRYQTLLQQNTASKAKKTAKHFGGIIQQFAQGGMATAPLIDDIKDVTGSLLPRPSSAISALIKAGGGAIDIDRTIKRTIGDTAYANAKTSGQQSAVLDRYFRDPKARLKDVASAPLTAFGKELQMAIKSGQLQPGRLSIVSKSKRVPGVAEYLSQLFGIPLGNMIFTQGGSKQPVMDALRAKGPRANRISRFASGGGVGTDTVPALLTPGEFVINRSSAQRIGYGNLNRMNKVGKYAKGGVVQGFAKGGSVKQSVQSAITSSTNPFTQQIAVIAKESAATSKQLNSLNSAISKQTGVTNNLYQKSALLDASIKKYDQELIRLAQQQGKAYATGTAAKRIVDLKIKAEEQRLNIDQQALSEEAKLTKMKTKQSQLIDKQNSQLEQKNTLISQAKQAKQQATFDATYGFSGPQSGTQSNFKDADQKLTRESAYAQARAKNRERQSNSVGGGFGVKMPTDIGGAAIAISMVTASLQAMLPPLNENSSAITKLSHHFLNMAMTLAGVVFSLQAFGVSLKAQSAMNFLGGGGLGVGGKKAIIGAAQGLGFGRNATVGILKTTNAIAKLAGPLAVTAATFYGIKTAGDFFVDSILGYAQSVKDAIDKGDINKAREQATSQASAKNKVTVGAGLAAGAAGGALIGSAILPIVGTAIGAAVGGALGGLTAFLSTDLPTYAGAVVAAQAAQVDVQNKLNKATEESTKALEEYNKGTKSGAEVIKTFSAAAEASNRSRTEVNKANNIGLNNTGFLGLRGAQRLKESEERTKGQNKQEEKVLQASMPGMNALAKDVALAGGSFDDFMNKLNKENPALYAILLRQGSTEVKKNFENIAKEVERSKKAFEALNLGLRAPIATASAMSSALSNFTAGLEEGATPIVQAISTLESSFSEAGQAMNPKDVQNAIGDVASTLTDLGASDKSVKMFKENAAAFAAVSANYTDIFEGVKEDFTAEDYKGLNAEGFTNKFAANLDEQLKNAGIGDEARKRMGDIVGNIKLDDEDMKKLRGGDFSVFQKYLGEAGNKLLEESKKIAEETAKVNQQLISLTKQRIEAERNLVEAQKDALDLTLEGREIQAKYGGPAVSFNERRANILGKANVEGGRLGLTNMRTGSISELKARNAEIRNRFTGIENQRRTVDAFGNKIEGGGLNNAEGVAAGENQKDLDKAYKTQIDTIRNLIKLEEEQLKITQEKNKLEKDSLESLVKGDVEEFFKKQAAVGATAAIATGDSRLMNLYGSEALGMASLDIQRQQEAGVQEIYGQQLGGAGGLTERAAGAALASRGITDMRAAQVMAGTTAEEEASKARLRELGGMLGETGQLGAEMAQMQVETATMNVNAAEVILADIKERGKAQADKAAAAEAMARGGIVYANRGIFVPRGTDTIPAMLTPGEFVVNRAAVQRGNNLQVLQAMNRGNGNANISDGAALMARGGIVRYRDGGSKNAEKPNAGVSIFENMSNFVTAISNFNSDLASNIEKLSKTTISIKLDSTSVNINLNDNGLLRSLTGQVKTEIFRLIRTNFKDSLGGSLREDSTVLG